jgi:hypothetical protein
MFVFLPAYVASFYLDVTDGPMFSHATKSYFFVVLPTFVLVDYFLNSLFKKLISNITHDQYFVECPACHFNNVRLVDACANCSYKKDNPLTPSAAKISAFLKGDKITPGLLNLLTLGEGEEILFHKKLTLNTAKFKNGARQARKHLVITTANLIILDYFSFHIRIPKSWRERDVVPLSEITAVEGKMKIFYNGMRPFLMIRTTHNDVYEIILSTFGKYIAEIKEIATIIKNANPQVEITIELVERQWKKFFKI